MLRKKKLKHEQSGIIVANSQILSEHGNRSSVSDNSTIINPASDTDEFKTIDGRKQIEQLPITTYNVNAFDLVSNVSW